METQNGFHPALAIAPEPSRRAINNSSPEETFDSLEGVGTGTTGQTPLLQISNAMVGLYKEAFGRGPIKARARFAGHDTLLVTLESSLTVLERNLMAMGEHQRLREDRLFLSYALENQFRAIVERALGRKTLAFVSGIDTARDVTVKLFTLEPAGEVPVGVVP